MIDLDSRNIAISGDPGTGPERLVSTMNQLNLAKNGLQCASNRGIRSTSVINGAFLLAFVTTPIDSAHTAKREMSV